MSSTARNREKRHLITIQMSGFSPLLSVPTKV